MNRIFKYWWAEEGSAITPKENEDTEEFARRITELAWTAAIENRLPEHFLTKEGVTKQSMKSFSAHLDSCGCQSVEDEIEAATGLVMVASGFVHFVRERQKKEQQSKPSLIVVNKKIIH